MKQKEKIYYCEVGNCGHDAHGNTYPVKEHKRNYNGRKIGVTKLIPKPFIRDFDDFIFFYIFCGWFRQFPCPAMQYYVTKKLKNI